MRLTSGRYPNLQLANILLSNFSASTGLWIISPSKSPLIYLYLYLIDSESLRNPDQYNCVVPGKCVPEKIILHERWEDLGTRFFIQLECYCRSPVNDTDHCHLSASYVFSTPDLLCHLLQLFDQKYTCFSGEGHHSFLQYIDTTRVTILKDSKANMGSSPT